MSPLLAALLATLATPALEVTVSVGGALGHSTTYEHRYVPRVDFDTTPGGSARQSIRIDPAKGPVLLQVAVARALGPRFGVELSASTSRWPIEGASGPHAYRLVYTSRPPPSGEPVVQVVDRERPWPDPEGAFRNVVLAAGLHRRFAVGEGTEVALFAGPSLHRVSGRLQSLPWLSARLGGHSVLFADEHALEVEMAPRWTPGIAAGASIRARLSPRAGLVLGARYHRAARAELQPGVSSIVNRDQLFDGLEAAEIARRLTPAPLHFQASFLQASIGVAVSR